MKHVKSSAVVGCNKKYWMKINIYIFKLCMDKNQYVFLLQRVDLLLNFKFPVQ